MDGKAEAVLRFALSTLFMKQGRSVVGRSEGSGGSVEAERNGLALGVDGASDYGFEPDEVDVGADACDEHLPEADAGQQLLFVVLACMGRLRDMCEDSYHDGEREVEGGFRGVARELREYTALHGTFADLLCLLMDLLRAADAEGETMDAASISHGSHWFVVAGCRLGRC